MLNTQKAKIPYQYIDIVPYVHSSEIANYL